MGEVNRTFAQDEAISPPTGKRTLLWDHTSWQTYRTSNIDLLLHSSRLLIDGGSLHYKLRVVPSTAFIYTLAPLTLVACCVFQFIGFGMSSSCLFMSSDSASLWRCIGLGIPRGQV